MPRCAWLRATDSTGEPVTGATFQPIIAAARPTTIKPLISCSYKALMDTVFQTHKRALCPLNSTSPAFNPPIASLIKGVAQAIFRSQLRTTAQRQGGRRSAALGFIWTRGLHTC